mgnify:FL=1
MINLNYFNNKKIVSIILVLLLCLSACSEENDLDKEDYKKLNLQEISFPKSSIDNKSFDIKTYNDEILLINFWFPSCPPCIYELDILNRLNNNYDSVNVLGIQALGLDTKEDGFLMMEKKGVSYKSIADENESIMNQLKINVFPTTILYDQKGNEIKRWIGIIDEDVVAEKIFEIGIK